MTLTADSGSTKTTWVLQTETGERHTYLTQGINPYHQPVETMRAIVEDELMTATGFPVPERVEEVCFYGAGCTKDKSPVLRLLLTHLFPNATDVTVDSDMLGAAKALLGDTEGIACILGTGANSCLYDGREIVAGVSPMGYILGDEGSGAVLGKTFVNLIYKGGHDTMRADFERDMHLTQADIIQRVYREPMANRFLASMCPFIHEHLTEEWVEDMVVDCFRLFFRRNIVHYRRSDLPCSFVGSVAFYFERQLRKAATLEGFTVGRILKEPLQ